MLSGTAAKMAFSVRYVSSASIRRWILVNKLATVMWSLPSPASIVGVTVAALATHMAEEEDALSSSAGASRHACSTTGKMLAQQRQMRPQLRRQYGRANTQRIEQPRKVEGLQSRFPWARNTAAVECRGHVIRRQAAIMVRWPRQAYENHFF